MKVHPVADLFPMLGEDELQDLAEDIKQRGLLYPIVLDGPDGWLLDGRNRLAACELAEVEPQFTYYDGTDPIGFILAANVNRRHMTKSQLAMVVAKARSDSEQSARSIAEQNGLPLGRVGEALMVIGYASELADAVISGGTPLSEAYRVARERKTAADSVESQLARLRAEDPEPDDDEGTEHN